MRDRNIFILMFLFLAFCESLLAGENAIGQIHYLQPGPMSAARLKLTGNLAQAAGQAGFISEINLPDEALPGGYKNKGTAFFRSLLLPGAGERYLGKKGLGKIFLITEVTLWLSYFAFREYGDWIQEDARIFAATHAGAQIEDKPSQYFVDIGFYRDIYQYNEAQQRMRQFSKVYPVESYYWSWESEHCRSQFYQMRTASDRAHNRAIFVLGGIFANHILSAIDAVWQTYRYNKKIDQDKQARLQLGIKTDYYSGAISLQVQKLF